MSQKANYEFCQSFFPFHRSGKNVFVVNKFHNRGFTLIELMVSLVIGLLVVLAASQIFMTVSNTNSRVQASAERQEALRYFYDVITYDIRNATALRFDSDSDELKLAFEGIESDFICQDSVEGFTKIYRFDLDESLERSGPGIYLETICAIVDLATATQENPELVVPGGVSSSLSFTFVKEVAGVKAIAVFENPDGILPAETIEFYIANRNTRANDWVE